jgi:nuclear pore complex protein Nup188
VAAAHAVRVVALDIQFASRMKVLGDSSASLAPPSETGFLAFAQSATKLPSLLSFAIRNPCDPDLHQSVLTSLQKTFPGFSLESARQPPRDVGALYDGQRTYGDDYLFTVNVAAEKLESYRSPDGKNAGVIEEAIDRIRAVNLNWSLTDCRIALTRGWRQLLEVALLPWRTDAKVVKAASVASLQVARETAGEPSSGDYIASVHFERLSLLLVLAEVWGQSPTSVSFDDIVEVFVQLAAIMQSSNLDPLDSLCKKTRSPYHQPLFQTLLFALKKLSSQSREAPLTDKQRAAFVPAIDTIVRVTTRLLREALLAASLQVTDDVERDLLLLVAVYQQLVHATPNYPLVGSWLACCREFDVFRLAFDVVVRMSLLRGRPLYSQHVVTLCLSLSEFAQAAEVMALEGITAALSNNELTPMAISGSITPVSADFPGERNPFHQLFCSMVALATRLVASLGSSQQFMDHIVGFIRLYEAQLTLPFSWTPDDSRLPLALIDEMHVDVTFFGVVAKRLSDRRSETGSLEKALSIQCLVLLQKVVYLLSYPNLLLSLVEPLSPAERSWIETELDGEPPMLSEDEPIFKRPVVSSLVQELLELAGAIVNTVNTTTQAFVPFRKEDVDWSAIHAVVTPVSSHLHVILFGERRG